MLTEDMRFLMRYTSGRQTKLHRIHGVNYSKLGTRTIEKMGVFPVRCRITSVCLVVTEGRFRQNRPHEFGNDKIRSRNKSLRKTVGHIVCSSLRALEEMWTNGSTWKCATDGGLKDGIGTCSVALWNVDEAKLMCIM